MRPLKTYYGTELPHDVLLNDNASFVITKDFVDDKYEYCVMTRDLELFYHKCDGYDFERDPKWLMLHGEVIMHSKSLSNLCMMIAIEGRLSKSDVVIGSAILTKEESDMILKSLK